MHDSDYEGDNMPHPPYLSAADRAAVKWWKTPVCHWATAPHTPPYAHDWPQT